MKNKKVLILLLAIIAVVAIVMSGCSKKTEEAAKDAKQTVEEAAEKAEEKAEEVKETVEEKVEEVKETVEEKVEEAKETVEEKVEEAKETVEEAAEALKVLSYDEYVKAEMDSAVTIEAYVQGNQSWYDGKIKLYLQDENHGAYFAYDLPCTEEDAAKLAVPGTKIRLSGVKSEWSGEVEILDGTYEILEGSFIAEPEDVTALLGKDELINHMNEKVSFKGLKVAPSKVEGKEEEYAFLYAWDGSGSNESNSDLYFNVELDGNVYNFCVESYLCGNDTEVYKAVEGLKVGDTIDCEGFLYWYNGANPHITGVTVK
ncbi:MAG: hypothetical protein IKE15_05510 [Clostridia bacterium]|nr:hypothetical protein [Clostridia bacterium]